MSWPQSSKRMGSKDARAKQVTAKRMMPEWRTIMPGIIRAFEKLKRNRDQA